MSARVATVGETMALMRSRDIGSLRHISDLVLGIGGAESNVAIGLRRLGIDTKWLGRVGDDPLVSQSPAKSGPRASKSTQSWIPTPRPA